MSENKTVKVCTKCDEEKSLDDFRLRKDHGNYVHTSICGECEKEQKREYHRTHLKEENAYKKMCYQTNRNGARDKSSKNSKKYYEENKPELLEQFKEYREEHKEELKVYHADYYHENKERLSAQEKARYENNREEILAQQQKYYHENRETILARRKEWGKSQNGKAVIKNANRRRKAAKNGASHEDWADFELEIRSEPFVVCFWCGELTQTDGEHCHMDHMIPLLPHHGADAKYNIVPTCADCNMNKKNKMPQRYVEWRFKKGLPLHTQFMDGELLKAKLEFKGGRSYNFHMTN